jgi:GTP-dependent phosphoenolpyruvate carboxykinase
MTGLASFGPDKFAAATAVSTEEWRREMPLHGEMVEGKLAEKAPKEMMQRYEELKSAFR